MSTVPGSMRILVVTGTRADFGLWRPILAEARSRPDAVSVSLLVGGMHLDQRFGSTVDEVRASGVPIAGEVAFIPPGDSREEMAASLGAAIIGMAPVIAAQAPDWLALLGDRGEQLAAALVALHLGVAIAHLHGGERSLGAVDDTLRDMISRAAHLHLVATEDAAARIGRMGEASWRIRRVGAPGLDGIRDVQPAGMALRRAVGLPEEGPYLLLLLHPETVGEHQGVRDLGAVLRAVGHCGLPTLGLGPNADAGGRAMLDALRGAAGQVTFRASLTREEFIPLLAGAAALVGNSSSALIEAPLLGVPAVNVGERQRGRTRGDNVIDVPAHADQIASAIRRAVDPSFRARLSRSSPYGDGHAAPRVIDALLEQRIDDHLLVKEVAP